MSSTDLACQISYDFSDGLGSSFQMEGDGVIAHQNFSGNPGGCMRIEEIPNGFESNIILPYETIGDWSNVLATDYISFDYLLHTHTDTNFIDSDFVIEIVGPTGKASTLPNYIPPSLDEWHSISMELDESLWDLTGVTWDELMTEVEFIRIRNEYIIGDEYILIDNISLSFSPIYIPWLTKCSNFDVVDGWSFIDVNDYDIDAIGVPINSVRIGDQGSVYSMGFAPPKYHGDWNDIENDGTIEFDLYIETENFNVIANKDIIVIGNEENSAKINLSDVDYADAFEDWQHFSFEIEEFEWEITEGTWEDIIDDVREIRLDLEFVIGGETVYLDNFCVSDNAVGVSENTVEKLKIYPNPSRDFLNFTIDPSIISMNIFDALGQHISTVDPNIQVVDIRSLSSGIYFLNYQTDLGYFSTKFVKK